MANNNISDVTNNMYNYVAPVNRLKMGNVVTEKIKNEGCNPRRIFYRLAGDNAELKMEKQ